MPTSALLRADDNPLVGAICDRPPNLPTRATAGRPYGAKTYRVRHNDLVSREGNFRAGGARKNGHMRSAAGAADQVGAIHESPVPYGAKTGRGAAGCKYVRIIQVFSKTLFPFGESRGILKSIIPEK